MLSGVACQPPLAQEWWESDLEKDTRTDAFLKFVPKSGSAMTPARCRSVTRSPGLKVQNGQNGR